jgi:hypothetical protein
MAQCPFCSSTSSKQIALSGKGMVISATKIASVPDKMEHIRPYWLALIQTSEGVRLTAQVVDVPEEVKSGTQVQAVLRKMHADGQAGIISYGIKWRPI